ncbi:hypothetical protein F4780DRAFT_782672 [Xylariomycetidae sp. FL0641]|nr:hypothetical protein F4780DRAFT_782672 [Xylariomycetidae sp. FL0641]
MSEPHCAELGSLRYGTRKAAARDAIKLARNYAGAGAFCCLLPQGTASKVRPVRLLENFHNYSTSLRPQLQIGKGAQSIGYEDEDQPLYFGPGDIWLEVHVGVTFAVSTY